ncbi:hypothetical protein B0H19DRAFT_1386483 [Mycena capillaripes]|nr:hypothetical protein B0H19DRAFT_1386483 [Mycena capillaripes]
MSVEGLQAHIDQLSAEIDAQRAALKKLERSKSAAQRQLNTLRDPMARLPLEISSEIFLHCLPPERKPNARTAPMLLVNVCNAWTDIALSTRRLWATIHMEFPAVDVLNVWLQRTRDYPLSISLRRSSLQSDVAIILGRYAEQIKNLEIYGHKFPDTTTFTSQGLLFLCLKTLTIGAVPNEEGILYSFSVIKTIGLLRLAPNLVQCTFHGVAVDRYHDSEFTEKLVLPSLLALTFEQLSQDEIISHLSLPLLEALTLPYDTISSNNFSLFLMRSSPPLQKLILGGGSKSFSLGQLEEWLRLVPSLAYLQLKVNQTTAVDDFFSTLAASLILPNLHTLKIRYNLLLLSDFSFKNILLALSVRRNQLVCFDLRFPHVEQAHIGSDVCNELRQLAADGIDMYIGSDNCNLFSL